MNVRILATLATLIIMAMFGWQVRAKTHGAAFQAQDDGNGHVLLTPMLPVTIRATQVSGPHEVNKREVLTGCQQGQDVQKVTQDGQEASVIQFRLTCGERVFILQAIRFEEAGE